MSVRFGGWLYDDITMCTCTLQSSGLLPGGFRAPSDGEFKLGAARAAALNTEPRGAMFCVQMILYILSFKFSSTIMQPAMQHVGTISQTAHREAGDYYLHLGRICRGKAVIRFSQQRCG